MRTALRPFPSLRPLTNPATRPRAPTTLHQADGGDQWYAGYAEMYDAVRAVSPDALVVMGGTGWSYDAVGPLAIWQQYKKEHNGTALRNVVYNLHGAFDAQSAAPARCARKT